MKERIIVQCGIQIDDEYWFAAGNTNGLFKINLLTSEQIFMGFFPDEDKTQFRAYTDIKRVGNKLIFTPCFAKEIAVYNLDENIFLKKSLSVYESGMNQYLKSVKYKNNVYLIPFSSSTFIKYDVCRDKINVLSGWSELRSKYIKKGMSNLIIESVCVDSNYIYMFMSDRNQVIILDMDVDKFQVKTLNISSDECICSVCKFDYRIWIVTDRNKIYQWDYINNEILHTFDFGHYITDSDYISHYAYAVDKYVYIINGYKKNIGVFDYINNKFTTIDMSKYIGDKTDDNVSLYYYFDIQSLNNNKISLFSYYDGKYVIIDGINVTDFISGFGLTEEYLEEVIMDKIFSHQLFYEGYTLREFSSLRSEEIKIILFQNISVKKGQNHYKESIGRLIYNTLTKKELQ